MGRRERAFITPLGGAATWPLVARAHASKASQNASDFGIGHLTALNPQPTQFGRNHPTDYSVFQALKRDEVGQGDP
jgi:hypothetical protein